MAIVRTRQSHDDDPIYHDPRYLAGSARDDDSYREMTDADIERQIEEDKLLEIAGDVGHCEADVEIAKMPVERQRMVKCGNTGSTEEERARAAEDARLTAMLEALPPDLTPDETAKLNYLE